MNHYQSALVTLLLTATAAMPCAAQQVAATPQRLPSEICAACFAYLVFPPSLEPQSYARRGEVSETITALPAEDEPSGAPRQQSAGLAAGFTGQPRLAGAP